MLTYPDIDPVALSIGPVEIRWYGLMYLAGFAAAWWLAHRRAKLDYSPCRPQQVDDLIFYGAMGVIVGGRIGYVLFYGLDDWADDPLFPLLVWKGGMSFHGGLLGVVAAMALFARHTGRGVWEITDFVAPLVPLGLGFGRIGNFINGELWGKPTDLPWGFLYDGVVRHPSQLYEALLEGFVLFAILWIYSSKPRPVRSVSGLFLICYGTFRSAIEFVRLPDADTGYIALGWVTKGQLLSVPMVLFGIYLLASAARGAAARRRPA